MKDRARRPVDQQKLLDAEQRGSTWLADGNEAAERGDHALAEKRYAKSQYWLDRANKLRGWD